MKIDFLFKLLKRLFFIFVIGLLCTNTTLAQVNKKVSKRKDKNKDRELVILRNVGFFVNDNSLPKYLKLIYKKDAARLALRHISKAERISNQTIRVPEELVIDFYNALVAIRTSELPVVDTIASIYNIRSFPIPNVENLILVFDKNAPWIQPLINGQDTTGNIYINNIIREYNLIISRIVYLDEENSGLVLKSREPLNIPVLMQKIFTHTGIGSIEEILPYGDGSDINIEHIADGWEVMYSVKFGDCAIQCPKSYSWKFKVRGGGEVAYLGGFGQTIPPWVGVDAYGKKYPDVLEKK